MPKFHEVALFSHNRNNFFPCVFVIFLEGFEEFPTGLLVLIRLCHV